MRQTNEKWVDYTASQYAKRDNIASLMHSKDENQGGVQYEVVPRKGLEPPRSYSLVPETSASTNSATWAFQERE